MSELLVPSKPLKVEDAAGRRYTVFFKQISPKKVAVTVKGQGLNETVDVLLNLPVLNWGWYARTALKIAIKKKYGVEPTRLNNEPEGTNVPTHLQMQPKTGSPGNTKASNSPGVLPQL